MQIKYINIKYKKRFYKKIKNMQIFFAIVVLYKLIIINKIHTQMYTNILIKFQIKYICITYASIYINW